VVYLYIGVGLLFLLAAALFNFSKVPAGISDEPMEKANKALRTLIIMTVLLFGMFTPVFLSYKSDLALQVEQLHKQVSV
jgi:FHS family L-fucose permease-like MFS transporter